MIMLMILMAAMAWCRCLLMTNDVADACDRQVTKVTMMRTISLCFDGRDGDVLMLLSKRMTRISRDRECSDAKP